MRSSRNLRLKPFLERLARFSEQVPPRKQCVSFESAFELSARIGGNLIFHRYLSGDTSQ